jgi:hypothetical protein
LAKLALQSLPEERINQALAVSALDHLTPEQFDTDLLKRAAKKVANKTASLDDKAIDGKLSKAATQALEDRKSRGYHGIIRDDAAKIIDLRLAVYGYGQRVKALFDSPGATAKAGAEIDAKGHTKPVVEP